MQSSLFIVSKGQAEWSGVAPLSVFRYLTIYVYCKSSAHGTPPRDMVKEMQRPKIGIVVAITSKDAAIGKGGKLLFHISDDLKRFKAITKGHPVIMGRKTYESIGRPLPERTNIVITRNPDFKAEGVIIAHSLEDALKKATTPLPPLLNQGGVGGGDEIFIIGGGEIYAQALPLCEKMRLTIVESDAEGDVFFPDWRANFTHETFREERFDKKTGLKYVWSDLERTT